MTPRRTKHRPRTKSPEERRGELMTAAVRLFLKNGIESTTIEQITTGAGVAKGTFYLYFSSKEDVLAGLRDRYSQDLLSSIKSTVAQRLAHDWKGKLATWVAAAVNGYLDSMKLHDIVFYASRPPADSRLSTENINIDYLCELLETGARARAWSLADPRFTATFLFCGLHGVVDYVHAAEKRVDRKRLIHNLQQLSFKTVGL